MTAGERTAGARLPAWLPASAAGRLATGYLGGVLLARLAGLALPIEFGTFAVTLSALAFPVLFWTVTKLAVRPRAPDRDRTAVALAAAAGIAGDEFVYLGFRADGLGYWSPTAIGASAGIGVLALGVVAVLLRTGRRDAPATPGNWFAALYGGIVALSFVGFRASQAYLRATGVPNEERSFVLFGLEIHHVTSGTALLVVAGLALALRGLDRRVHRVAAAVAAVGAGFVADQYTYVFYRAMTDARYFSEVSLLGGALATGTIIICLMYHVREASEGTIREHGGRRQT